MSITKELFLFFRAAYAFMMSAIFWPLGGLPTPTRLFAVHIGIFLASFMWQYFVFNKSLRRIPNPQGRQVFLRDLGKLATIATVISSILTALFSNPNRYDDPVTFELIFSVLSSGFVVFASMLTAVVCTRQAWKQHGGLG